MDVKLLAEWFWTDRWIGSSAFLLPLEMRGLYREMLTQAWRRGARLPLSETAIKRAVGATDEEWARTWPYVTTYWHETKGGVLVDVCKNCKGLWLDRGEIFYFSRKPRELERLLEADATRLASWFCQAGVFKDALFRGIDVPLPGTVTSSCACPAPAPNGR